MLTVSVNIDGFNEDGKASPDVQAEIIETVVSRIVDELSSEVRMQVKEHVANIVNVAITKQVDQVVSDWFTKPIQPTDNYGQKKGDPITFAEHVAGTASAHIRETVDRHGKPSSYGENCQSRLQYLAGQISEAHVKEVLAPELSKVVRETREKLGNMVAKSLKDALIAAAK